MYLEQLIHISAEDEKLIFRQGYKKIDISAKPILDPYYDMMNEAWSSPMSFMAMIAWKTALTFYYKPIGSYLVCIGWDATEGKMTVLPFLGRYEQASMNDAFPLFQKDFREMGFPIHFTDMREWMRPYYEAIPGSAWKRIDNDDLNDYVYRGSYFERFPGKSGQKQRYFLKTWSNETSELVPEDLEELRNFIRQHWCMHTDCSYCNYGCQADCIENIVPVLKQLGGFGILVRIEGEIAGYCIGSRHGELAILHFQNTRPGFKGLGEYMYSECRRRFLKEIEWISLGEDMGVPGIRTYKTRLAPHEWIPRFGYDYLDNTEC